MNLEITFLILAISLTYIFQLAMKRDNNLHTVENKMPNHITYSYMEHDVNVLYRNYKPIYTHCLHFSTKHIWL